MKFLILSKCVELSNETQIANNVSYMDYWAKTKTKEPNRPLIISLKQFQMKHIIIKIYINIKICTKVMAAIFSLLFTKTVRLPIISISRSENKWADAYWIGL